MKKTIIIVIAMMMGMHAMGQIDPTKWDQMLEKGEYKNLYAAAERVYNQNASGRQRLTAAYYMAMAAGRYQEEAYDTSAVRYRRLLPDLDTLERALCHAFLGEYDSALLFDEVLKRTPVEEVKPFCQGGTTLNVTPTAYDMIVLQMQDAGVLSPQDMVEWQERLCDFHRQDVDDVRIWHEVRLLQMMDNVPNHPLEDTSILRRIEVFSATKSPYYTLLHHLMATRHNARGECLKALDYCDKAIAFNSRSEGGTACANLRKEILRTEIDIVGDQSFALPGEMSLRRVTYRNLDHLWLRIVDYDKDYTWGRDETKKRLQKMKPITQWDLPVASNAEHRREHSYLALPPLPEGRYLLLISPDKNFSAKGFEVSEIVCTDMLLATCMNGGMLLERHSGQPIVGQEVRLCRQQRGEMVTVETRTTDNEGRFDFGNSNDYRWNTMIEVERNGVVLRQRAYNHVESSDTTLHYELRTDRPIYKPGDTVHLAVVGFYTDGVEALVADHRQATLHLFDPNMEEVATDSITTDDFGLAACTMTIPTDRLAGTYYLRVDDKSTGNTITIRVEDYKQPKFMVSLEGQRDTAPAFGREYRVEGMASSYSGEPVGGARVRYTVTRSLMHRCWWWYPVLSNTEVATGEVATSDDGTFVIPFVPMPDSTVELSVHPSFQYTVSVDVTDINGESHPASTTFRIGYRNSFIRLEDTINDGRTLAGLQAELIDINGNRLPGSVDIRIERLQQPDKPLLSLPYTLPEIHHTMDREAFRKAFPLMAYDVDYNDPSKWPVAEQGWKGRGGVYRITLTADGADTLVEYRTVTPNGATHVASQELLWDDVDHTTAEVGQNVVVRFGTRFRDVEVRLLLHVGNEQRYMRRYRLTDRLESLVIPVDSTMLGGFNVEIFAVAGGHYEHHNHHVEVPFVHKQLTVDVATFRDHLLPGQSEQWTLRVQGLRTPPEPSALILTLYDDALNSYGTAPQWAFNPWRMHPSLTHAFATIYMASANYLDHPSYSHYNGKYPTVWRLVDALPHYWPRFGSKRMYSKSMNANTVFVTEAVEEDEAFSVQSMDARATVDALADGAQPTVAAMESAPEAPAPDIRTNLNTLAFFAPDIRTDSDGVARFAFTMPDLLTRWNLRGMAFTRDIKVGTLNRTLVTRKQLMVQPNVPRFIRQADTLAFLAKVINLGESARAVAVTFDLTDAATGGTIATHATTLDLPAGGTLPVAFPIEMPENVYVAQYTIRVATTDNGQLPAWSDGERGQIPVLSNRQVVTVSQSLYVNGPGCHEYTLPVATALADSSRQPILMAAEVTSTPIWLALKSMPHLADLESPSSVYLANQLYVSTTGSRLFSGYDTSAWKLMSQTAVSPLHLNDDVKQTLLQTTPWVVDALDEERQYQAVAQYFDRDRMSASIQTLRSQLVQRQNPDGGWSWMPDGQSSLWATLSVLRRLSGIDGIDGIDDVRQRALRFTDARVQQDYERYIKPHLRNKRTPEYADIEYLYVRSLYGEASTEAWRYHYRSALSLYTRLDNLYSLAQLAVVFHRAGDRRQALDILHRLRQRSLESDEMGIYWRDNRGFLSLYQRPIETQAMLIRAFAEVEPTDTLYIARMQQWLLKQKQTTHWGNDVATVEAIQALIVGAPLPAATQADSSVTLTLFGQPLEAPADGLEGYRSSRYSGARLDTLMAAAADNPRLVIARTTPGIAWGAVYYQFADRIDRIPATDMGLRVVRTCRLASDADPDASATAFAVGDKVTVRIDIHSDRALDHVMISDPRPSTFEPLSTRSRRVYAGGLSCYLDVRSSETRLFIDHIDRGHYTVEYDVYVTNPGCFLSGPLVAQCLYAPEFRSIASAIRISVANP